MDSADRLFAEWRSPSSLWSHLDTSRLPLAIPILQDVALVGAVAWIVYRVYQIYQQPVDNLVDLLGLDIPSSPEVSLAGITTDSVQLFWKPPEKHPTTIKHSIQVNGIKVGEIDTNDGALSITGLKPGHFYNVRVIATNTSNFSTLGPLIQVRTAHEARLNGISQDGLADRLDKPKDDGAAIIRATSSQIEPITTIPTHQSIAKDASAGHSHSRRTASGRRSSPADNDNEHEIVSMERKDGDPEELDEDVKKLTARAANLRKTLEDVDRQIQEDDQDAKQVNTESTRERDQLREELKGKEAESSDLKKKSNELSQRNRAAQNRKTAQERILNQKKAERQRVIDDMTQWNDELAEMREDINQTKMEKDELLTSQESELWQIRKQITDSQRINKSLEDDIHEKGIQIKDMEKKKEQLNTSEDQEIGRSKMRDEQDRIWNDQARALQSQLAMLLAEYQSAFDANERAQGHLTWWSTKFHREPHQFTQLSYLDNSQVQGRRSKRSQQSSSRGSTISSPPGIFPEGIFAQRPASGVPSSVQSNLPQFSIHNSSRRQEAGLSQVEINTLTGGGPMSPGANNLLPSDLFGEDDAMEGRFPNPATRGSRGSMGSDHQSFNQPAPTTHSPHTPGSASSRSNSIFSSPHDSMQNLRGYREGNFRSDTDLISTGSSNSPFPPTSTTSNLPASRGFRNRFGIGGRSREKSASAESPALGTLSQGQSQSYPRQTEEHRKPNTLFSTAPFAGLLNRGSGTSHASSDLIVRTPTESGKSSRLNELITRGSRANSTALASGISSRPTSISSFEGPLGRASNDSYRLGSRPTEIPYRTSSIGAGRASIPHGSTSNLSMGSTPLEDKPMPEQAPIGTRPQSSQTASTPKLNPNARPFKFPRGLGDIKKSSKSEKLDGKGVESMKTEENFDPFTESSPPDNRHSRDSQSILTTSSTADQRDSLDHSTSDVPSESATPSGKTESIMAKLMRKSSSKKIESLFSKDRGGLLSKKPGEPSTPDEMEEGNTSETQPGSIPGTPHQEKTSRTAMWGIRNKKSRKGGQSATDTGEKGSEAGDDYDV